MFKDIEIFLLSSNGSLRAYCSFYWPGHQHLGERFGLFLFNWSSFVWGGLICVSGWCIHIAVNLELQFGSWIWNLVRSFHIIINILLLCNRHFCQIVEAFLVLCYRELCKLLEAFHYFSVSKYINYEMHFQYFPVGKLNLIFHDARIM